MNCKSGQTQKVIMQDGRSFRMEQEFLWYATHSVDDPSSVYSFHPKNETPITTHDTSVIKMYFFKGNNLAYVTIWLKPPFSKGKQIITEELFDNKDHWFKKFVSISVIGQCSLFDSIEKETTSSWTGLLDPSP